MKILKNKTATMVASIILIVVASALLMIGMLVTGSGTYLGQEVLSVDAHSVSEEIKYINELAVEMPLLLESTNLFDYTSSMQAYKDSIILLENALPFLSAGVWSTDYTYMQSLLSLAQTAIAGFAVFMIAIPVIGWTGFLFAKK